MFRLHSPPPWALLAISTVLAMQGLCLAQTQPDAHTAESKSDFHQPQLYTAHKDEDYKPRDYKTPEFKSDYESTESNRGYRSPYAHTGDSEYYQTTDPEDFGNVKFQYKNHRSRDHDYSDGQHYRQHRQDGRFYHPKHYHKHHGSPPPSPENPPSSGDPGLVLVNDRTAGFFEVNEPLQWLVENATLLPSSVSVEINGVVLTGSSVVTSSTSITANLSGIPVTTSSKVNVTVVVTTTSGMALSWQEGLWIGDRTLLVTVILADNKPAVGATVLVQVAQDTGAVSSAISDAAGSVQLTGLPIVSLFVSASSSDGNLYASNYAVPAGLETITLKLLGVPEPSLIDNNDITQGTLGWDVDVAGLLNVVDHVEILTGARMSETDLQKLQMQRRAHGADIRHEPSTPHMASMPKVQQPAQPAQVEYPNFDLVVDTGGIQGPVTATRTFTVPPGSGRVEIRYRFETAEFPFYYGSQFDDTYTVTLRSKKKGLVLSGGSSLNSVPASSYTTTDKGGSTEWFTRQVQVDPEGDVVQVILSVANVGDNAYQSYLYLDYVTAGRVCIRPLDNPVMSWTTLAVHCYLDAVVATFAYDPEGVLPEKKPNAPFLKCVEVKGASSEELVNGANAVTPFYQRCTSTGTWQDYFCTPPKYNIALHNCCHFVDAALQQAGSQGVTSYFPTYALFPDIQPPPNAQNEVHPGATSPEQPAIA